MGKIAHDADAIHLSNNFMPEIREPTVNGFIAASRRQVLGIVRHLNDADAAIFKELNVSELILEGGDVLKSENDGSFSVFLGLTNVRDRSRGKDKILALVEEAVPARDILHRAGEIFPDRTRTIRGRQSTFPHVFENRSRKVGNYQSIDNNQSLVKA